jgi:superkiller protein 3
MNDWDDAERRVERAQELFDQRRWSEALEEFRAAADINPYNAAWHYNIGLTLDEMGRFDEAIAAYRRASEIDPNDLRVMTRIGIDQQRMGNLDESIRTFEQIERRDPSFEPSYCNRILVYAELGDHDRAEEMFYSGRLFKEHCPDCYYNLGLSLLDRRRFDKAVWCFRRAQDLDEAYPDVELRIAEALWGKGELEAARQHYLVGLRRDPGNTDVLLDLGELLSEMGRSDEAGEKFRRAVELAPERPAGYFCYGQWLVRHGGSADVERAIEQFRRTLALDPTFPGAHLRLAELHHRRGERSPARKHLRAEMLLRPTDPRVVIDLSNLLMDTGLTRAAVVCLKRLTAHHPDEPDGWQNLAVAQFLSGRYEEGIESCRQVLALDSNNLTAMYNLALAHERIGYYDQATFWVQQGLRIDPRDAAMQKLELRIRVLRWKDCLLRVLQGLLFPRRSGGQRGLTHLWKFRSE